jgi:hypothetical protein
VVDGVAATVVDGLSVSGPHSATRVRICHNDPAWIVVGSGTARAVAQVADVDGPDRSCEAPARPCEPAPPSPRPQRGLLPLEPQQITGPVSFIPKLRFPWSEQRSGRSTS